MPARQTGQVLGAIAVLCFIGAAALPGPATVEAEPVPAPVSAPEPPKALPKPAPPQEVRVPILTYHHVRAVPAGVSASNRQYEVPPEALDRQLAWLEEQGYTSVSFDDVHDALVDGDPLPEKPVVISFDDGRDSQYLNAFPLLVKHGFTATFFPFTNAIGRPGYLTWDQLKEMRAAGMEIGNHTRYHAYLTRLTDPVEIEAEIVGSKKTLEEGLGEPVTALAYPFGLRDERVISFVREAGYETARSITQGETHRKETLLDLGSVMPTEDFQRFTRLME